MGSKISSSRGIYYGRRLLVGTTSVQSTVDIIFDEITMTLAIPHLHFDFQGMGLVDEIVFAQPMFFPKTIRYRRFDTSVIEILHLGFRTRRKNNRYQHQQRYYFDVLHVSISFN